MAVSFSKMAKSIFYQSFWWCFGPFAYGQRDTSTELTADYLVVCLLRNMPQFPDSSFSAVLDKGTLDTLLCGGNAYRDVANMLAEVRRYDPL